MRGRGIKCVQCGRVASEGEFSDYFELKKLIGKPVGIESGVRRYLVSVDQTCNRCRHYEKYLSAFYNESLGETYEVDDAR